MELVSSDRDTENEKVNEKAVIDSLCVRKTRTDRQTDRQRRTQRETETNRETAREENKGEKKLKDPDLRERQRHGQGQRQTDRDILTHSDGAPSEE